MDEMQPRMAQMAMMRDRFMQNRNQADQARAQFNGGLSLPEQLPQGPIDPSMQMPMRRSMPIQAQGIPQRLPMPMGQPPQQGTPAQMPMANTMNPNAPSARPSMMSNQKQMRGQMMSRQAQAQAGQRRAAQQPVPGAELAGPRSVTPF